MSHRSIFAFEGAIVADADILCSVPALPFDPHYKNDHLHVYNQVNFSISGRKFMHSIDTSQLVEFLQVDDIILH